MGGYAEVRVLGLGVTSACAMASVSLVGQQAVGEVLDGAPGASGEYW